jgi:hypothetical protein
MLELSEKRRSAEHLDSQMQKAQEQLLRLKRQRNGLKNKNASSKN